MDRATDEEPLAELLAPMGTNEFFATHWERAPLHVSRPSDRGRFDGLLSSRRIESLLGTRELRHPDVQLSRADDPVAVADYTDAAGRVLPRRLLEHHAAGASLVLSGAHREFDSLAAFRRRMERGLQLRCQANVYRSPPGRQGFHAHHDTHDVFVLQLEGRKRFDFHQGGLELPLAEDSFRPALHPAGDLAESVLLEPGDTLYIPRGVTHDALAADDAPSLHVTLGVFAVTVHDVLAELLRVAAERDVALRRSLDRSLWTVTTDGATAAGPNRDEAVRGAPDGRTAGRPADDPARRGAIPRAGRSVDRLAGELADRLAGAFSVEHLDEALARLRDELSLEGTPDCGGSLVAPEGHGAPDADACIAIVPEAILNVERHDARVLVRTFGQTLEFDPPLAPALERLLQSGSARLDTLPGLDDDQRAALARRLLDAGIVRRTAAEPGSPEN